MRIPPRALILFVGLVLSIVFTTQAQETQSHSSDLLRYKIEQLEKIELKSKSSSVQDIYKRSLIRLYSQYVSALQQDIVDLREIQSATSGTGASSQNEISAQIKKLSSELIVTSEKIQTLTGDLKVAVSTETPAPKVVPASPEESPEFAKISNTTVGRQRSVSSVANGPANGPVTPYSISDIPVSDRRTAESNAVTTVQTPAAKVLVSGTVYVTNKYFYKNPEDITPARLQRGRLVAMVARNPQARLTPQQTEQLEIARQENQGSEPEVRNEYSNKKGLNHPLANVEVKVEKLNETGGKSEIYKTITGSLGNYQVQLDKGDYIISVSTENFSASESVSVTADPIQQDLQIVVKPLGEYSRAIVGLEQAGASSAKSVQKYFIDLTVSTPFPFSNNIDPYFGARSRAWGTIRVTTVPQQITSTVGTFAPAFATEAAKVKVNEVAQGVEFLAGVEYRLVNGGRMPFPFASFDNSTTNKFTLSLIAGAGAITPFNPRDTLEIFKVFPGATGLPPEATGKDFIAFVSPDRDRFFRQYYAGFRLHTYYFNAKNEDIPLTRYPATLDLTYGQNEAVTGGRLRGGIVRLEGFFPLPYEGLKFINLFGTGLFKLTRGQITDPLILEPAPAGTTVPATNAVIVTVPQINRDYYRIGVGIDFISFIKSMGAGKKE